MRKSTAAILTVLILSALASARRGRTVLGSDETSGDAAEHQRILEELEEVHQLRERMLQEGESHVVNTLQLRPLKPLVDTAYPIFLLGSPAM